MVDPIAGCRPEAPNHAGTPAVYSQFADAHGERHVSRWTTEEVEPLKAPGIIAQSSLNLYDPQIGLNVYSAHLPVEDLIV